MDILATVSKWVLPFLSLFLPQYILHNVIIFLKTLPRDLKCGFAAFNVILRSHIHRKMNVTTISRFKNVVNKHQNKPCFLFHDQVWTYLEVDDFSNKIANAFKESGFKKGDVVALVMTNRPEYPCIWLGLAKIGVVTALINCNLTNKPLIHSIKTASCSAIIFSDDLVSAVLDVRQELSRNLKYYQFGNSELSEGIINLKNIIQHASSDAISVKGINHDDHLVYIYTSGTTGLPKAAIVPHSRYLLMLLFGEHLVGLTCNDIVYDPLPLYHTAGGLLGVGVAILKGGTVVLRKKFSAASYIPDCIQYNCTVGQYIGEICRYVLAVPEKPTDKQHKLRMIAGNGLRPAIWVEFVKRFNVQNVMEMYGSTEGNLQFVNVDSKVGAVGSIPRFLPFSRLIGAIIKVNAETMEPIRGENGLCIECEIDEPGMFVGIIPNIKKSVKEFHGYLDKTESRKKYIYNVFKKGDKAFVSGDLIAMDELGYLYFKDRTGDTFRWKGENVSTSEVEAIISTIIGLKDCAVYGVQIGELEGRAGMAAIADPSGSLDFKHFANSIKKSLPAYAHPVFIRLVPETELTGTFKLKKTCLSKEGFNPLFIKDPLYFYQNSTYIPLTEEIYSKIISGQIRV